MQPLYPNRYVWFVFLSAMDVMMTYVVLRFGGSEANNVAAWILYHWGFIGMIIFKFVLVALVIIICEYVGRRNRSYGRLLIHAGLVLTCLPVVIAFGLLIIETWW